MLLPFHLITHMHKQWSFFLRCGWDLGRSYLQNNHAYCKSCAGITSLSDLLHFDHLQYAKNGGRRPRESYHVIHGTAIMCRHACFQQPRRACTRLILESVLAMIMGQVPSASYRASEAKSYHSKGLPSDKCENIQQWCNHLVEQKDSTIWSCTAVSQPSLSGLGICFTGRAYVFSESRFSCLAYL